MSTAPLQMFDGKRKLLLQDAAGTYAEVVASAAVLYSTTGEPFLADGPASYNYNADGTINYVQIAAGSDSFRQTWTWTNGQLTSTSGWVKQ